MNCYIYIYVLFKNKFKWNKINNFNLRMGYWFEDILVDDYEKEKK